MNTKKDEYVKVRENNKRGFDLLKIGGVVDFSQCSSKTRRGRVQGGGDISPSLLAQGWDVFRFEKGDDGVGHRIRKLTSRECGRLQNVSEKDMDAIEKEQSETQCYQAYGNSICVSVMCALFSQLNIAGVKPWNDMTDDERYELIYKGCCVHETEDI